VRNTIYFDGNGIGKALIVLAAYLVAGAVVVFGIRRRTPYASDADTDIETAAGAAAVVV
jgi:hypothetical protein